MVFFDVFFGVGCRESPAKKACLQGKDPLPAAYGKMSVAEDHGVDGMVGLGLGIAMP